ncbi:hypothetical protein Hanom_Chr15g01387631 [Helianthus anomalus]
MGGVGKNENRNKSIHPHSTIPHITCGSSFPISPYNTMDLCLHNINLVTLISLKTISRQKKSNKSQTKKQK